ncbi:carboxylesterase/lipase family protein [Asticcacaulis solisilvae]|uniref:carboxylesterase/lipase family protein n=1 Tax=Asticcacaulis solisilvae TaxID=1217274 RepID=UPI003FD8A3A4
MKSVFASVLAAVLLPSAALPSAVLAAGPQVVLPQGTVEGITQYTVDSFKGIPYAAPPVGALRWRAPQAPAPWQGVRVADRFAPDCMQVPVAWDDAPSTVKPAEDCLYLNVWRPAAPAKKLPVMVWIHGGGFVNGGTSPEIYDGAEFAKDGVVFVSINYRLGRFGFFAFPALSHEDADHGLLGDYAFMDQIAALKWVQANIAAFGGDPGNVTIFGESAGGASVHALLMAPDAKGLFARAIIQSGGGRSLLPPRDIRTDRPDAPSAETLGVNFARKNGIAGADAKALAALRALPADAVAGELNMATSGDQKDIYSGMIADGRLVRETPDRAYAAGRYTHVPVMVGANSADISNINAAGKDALFDRFGPLAAQARAAYDPSGDAPLEAVQYAVGMDGLMSEPARLTAATLSAQGGTTYEYRFGYTASGKRANAPFGAPHASELPFVFARVAQRYGEDATADDHAEARLMHAYWVNFAKTGNPNGAGLTDWPAYTRTNDVILIFTPDVKAVAGPDPWKARLDVTAANADRR